MKIVFLGDSLTWGGYGGNYVDEVKNLLPDHEIINAGVGGNTVLNLLARLESDVLPHEPDRVFVMVGGNDAIAYSQPGTRPYYEQAQNVPDGEVTPDQFTRAYRELIETLQLHYVTALVGLPPLETNSAVVQAMREFNALAEQVARSYGVPVLDLASHFIPDEIPDRQEITLKQINLIGQRMRDDWDDHASEREKNAFTYTFDGAHLTEESAREMGRLIAEFIASH